VLPERLREDPKIAVVGGLALAGGLIAAGLLIFGVGGDVRPNGQYVCDACNQDYEAPVPTKGGPTTCPKCGAVSNSKPTFARCPECQKVFVAYRRRAKDGRMEFKFPAKNEWLPEEVTAAGTTGPNPEVMRLADSKNWTCPNCQFSPANNPGKSFNATPEKR
jgi:hypothetical protein